MASRIEQKQRAREQRLAAEQAARQGDRRRARLMRLGLVLGLAVVLVIAAIVVSSGSGSSSTSAATGGNGSDVRATTALFKGVPQDGIHLGKPSARATLIEFADLQCPFCKEFSNDALPTVVKNYVRTGKLRYELQLRSFLGKDSQRAAGAAAVATKENRLYQFADLFYRRSGTENTGYVTDGFLRSVAQGAGVPPGPAVSAAGNPQGQPRVGQAEQLAQSVGSSSTPAFYLRLASGRLIPLQPQDLTGPAISQAIDAALPGT